MLIAKEDVNIKYNGKIFELKSGDKFDVRDFDVPNAGVVNTEKHIMTKNPGKLEITSNKSDAKDYADNQKTIKALNTTIKELQDRVKDLKEANEELVQKHSAMAGEVSSVQQSVKSFKTDNDRLIKENKELEDEIQKLRLRVATKGK